MNVIELQDLIKRKPDCKLTEEEVDYCVYRLIRNYINLGFLKEEDVIYINSLKVGIILANRPYEKFNYEQRFVIVDISIHDEFAAEMEPVMSVVLECWGYEVLDYDEFMEKYDAI